MAPRFLHDFSLVFGFSLDADKPFLALTA